MTLIGNDSYSTKELGMTIRPKPIGHPQEVPAMGGYIPTLMGMGTGSSNYPQTWTGMGAGTGTLMPSPPRNPHIYKYNIIYI